MTHAYTLQVIIIGGTAAYWLDPGRYVRVRDRITLKTPYGLAAPITVLETPSGLVGFTSRHGEGGLQRSARFVNHRANVWAAHRLGTRWMLSWNGVGSLHPDWAVRDLVVLSDVVDFTRGRVDTYCEGDTRESLWGQIGPAFAERPRRALIYSVTQHGITVHTEGVYACSEGPRLETAAEIRLFRQAGADVVGMTLCPEVWLARELGIGYGSLAYITNHATGIRPKAASGREFGPIVAETCFPILLRAAQDLTSAGEDPGHPVSHRPGD
ncbi:MAG: MTAP family purine nucleoside phosphorylase [Chloroflexi bacterium]|nr:MTAP family purine nucleoside phosphorylase [Chloroflexota bacterium]